MSKHTMDMTMDTMELCTPLFWGVLFLIGTKASAQDVEGVSLPLGPAGGSVVRLHMEVEAPEAWNLSLGASAVITCSINQEQNQDLSRIRVRLVQTTLGAIQVLSSAASSSGPLSYTLGPVTLEHRGLYSCEVDGAPQKQNVSVESAHRLLWVHDDSARVTINVLSHKRAQFFSNELVTVGCRLPQGEHDHWRLMRLNKWTGVLEECPGAQVSEGVLSCSEKTGYPWADELHWCESELGQRSNALNLTSTVTHTVLEAPPLPVMEGDDLTLRCLKKDKVTGDITVASAYFSHNDQYLKWEDEESITIRNVTKANEGFYKCTLKSLRRSLDSYVVVKARPQEQKNH